MALMAAIEEYNSLMLKRMRLERTLKAENLGGKTLTVNGEISVGTLSLSGKETATLDEDKYLKIDGSGSFTFSTSAAGIYL